jgi:WhiB family transcriptional regulator, redox-sensing transcriptional regulator
MNLNEALLTSVDRELVARGRCADGAGTMAGLFFSEELHEIAQAKAICTNCTVTDRCLSGALIRREPWGVWGGELVMNGKVLAARRRRGRPPKIRPSDMSINELGQVISA